MHKMRTRELYRNIYLCRPGSIVVDYRVSWPPTADYTMNEEVLNNSIVNYVQENHNYMNEYLLSTASFAYTKQEDNCAMGTLDLEWVILLMWWTQVFLSDN